MFFFFLVSNAFLFAENHSEVARVEEGTPRSCSDPFSIFAFLAFALAVMDLMMEMMRKR